MATSQFRSVRIPRSRESRTALDVYTLTCHHMLAHLAHLIDACDACGVRVFEDVRSELDQILFQYLSHPAVDARSAAVEQVAPALRAIASGRRAKGHHVVADIVEAIAADASAVDEWSSESAVAPYHHAA